MQAPLPSLYDWHMAYCFRFLAITVSFLESSLGTARHLYARISFLSRTRSEVFQGIPHVLQVEKLRHRVPGHRVQRKSVESSCRRVLLPDAINAVDQQKAASHTVSAPAEFSDYGRSSSLLTTNWSGEQPCHRRQTPLPAQSASNKLQHGPQVTNHAII